MDTLANVNWLAVIAGTIVSFFAGWLWYSQSLFGKKWAEGSGVQLGSASSIPIFAMLSQLLALLMLALVVGITETTNALLTAILAIVTVTIFALSMGAFIKKSGYALAVDASYILVAGVIMILAQGLL